MRQPISVLIPTYNCASIVRNTLESVKWADEILVVDSFSTDATLDVCREYGARIIQHAYENSAKQKNWAVPQCAHAWVLQVDSDEVLEPGLAEEIQQTVDTCPPDVHGFDINFKHHVLGKWVKQCRLYPEYHLRLFRRDVARFEDKEVHSHIRLSGPVPKLRLHILHYGMDSIAKQLSNLDRYSRYQADELAKRGKRCTVWHVTLRPLLVFLLFMFRHQGILAGYRGLVLSAMASSSVFWSWAKLWELQHLKLPKSPLP